MVGGAADEVDGVIDLPPLVLEELSEEAAALGAPDLGELADVELAGVGAGRRDEIAVRSSREAAIRLMDAVGGAPMAGTARTGGGTT